MQQRRSIRFAAVLVVLAFLAGACGGGGGVGKGLKVNGKGQGGQGAIGNETTTTVAAATTLKPVTTLRPTVTTAAVPSAIYKIQSDTQGQYIDPLSHNARAGSLVRFTNADASFPSHTITLKMGGVTVLQSPPIANGANWDVRPTTRGTYDIVDEQRTYAVGATLTVTG
jgi:plastocyanin